MPMICVVYGCSNRSNREKSKSFYRVPKIVQHKGAKCKEQTKKRRDKWLANLLLSFGGAESENARVCSDHFVKGRPSALKDVDCVDWAPTVDLGYAHPYQPMSEASRRRCERLRPREGERRRCDGAEAPLELEADPVTLEDQQGKPYAHLFGHAFISAHF
ncbi:hypothetical protein N1851_013911 [Merluccius polli]|uniref:THAP-type domain-containing protein n=1 Tax=Merluccius polli TaxID=89951 RepID=A0AA47MVG9_MERPO|nr:hypothetical protein N1851_013911 [Merluccius polli]